MSRWGGPAPTLEAGEGFRLHPRGIVPAATWAYQNAHGRRWYRRYAVGRPPERRSLAQLAPAPGSPTAP